MRATFPCSKSVGVDKAFPQTPTFRAVDARGAKVLGRNPQALGKGLYSCQPMLGTPSSFQLPIAYLLSLAILTFTKKTG